MVRGLLRGTVFVWLCVISACFSADITECPQVDCPKEMVCDRHGGCALPDQLSTCAGKPDGAACSYKDRANATIEGACNDQLCVPLGCGNAIVSPDELCDDGNNISGDGCSADCRSLETCGNGVTDSATGEQCDDGNVDDGDGCQHDCKLPRCGDGVKDTELDEECDAGDANSSSPDAACRPNCQLPRCGDGVTDSGANEVCDDGNNASADGCSGDCKSDETCGNSIVDALAGEQCDDGNAVGGDGCSADCLSVEVCGNGVVDMSLGEVCDDGNTVSGDGCSSDCRSLEVCGNGIIDTINEQCDLGTMNSNDPDSACRTTCKLPVCGDMIKDPLHGEQCDDGMMNADAADACRTNCKLPRCGDTIQDSAEVCDDGNTTAGDGCSSDCRSLETCGNGIIDTVKGEQCDNGTSNSTGANATCRPDCTSQRCGDSIIDDAFGEICDLGAMNSNAANATCRTNCAPQRCGDRVIDDMKGEVCDDGNIVSGDGCSADCQSDESCGNGIVDASKGEQCDAGTLNANDPNAPCRTNCTPQVCGDSIVDDAFGETCDLGGANSDAPDATCRLDCTLARCGDNILDAAAGEVCDDGDNTSGDGCSGDCKSLETCGNGIIDTATGEECDDGNGVNADGCHNDCTLPRCGDGVLDANEQCDEGTANSNGPNATCRTTCVPQRCGDGIFDDLLGEVCDDSNNASGDGCSADCRSNETCGNGVVDPQKGELCDDGNTRGRDGCSGCKPETAVVVQPGNVPTARHSQVLVYDGARQRVVMFGGYTPDGPLGDTWEWDGVSWTQQFPKHTPSPRFDAAAAYDPVRKRVVLFGGYVLNYGGAVQDTWEYDGVDWTQRSPATVPAARAAAAMAFDGASRQLLMFGGYGTVINQETWRWDGSNWTQLSPATVPGARDSHSMAWDAVNKYVVMFGGEPASGGNDNHVWTWNGSNWTDRGATSGPTAGPSITKLTFDANRGKVVAWGGNGTYEWSGTGWTSIAGGPTTPRGYMPLTYDAARKQVVGFGGATDISSFPPYDVAAYSDTWLRSSTTWSSAPAFSQPSARMRAGLGYDPLRRKVVLFGGQCGTSCSLADTWEWDGRTWRSVAATTPPAARAGQVLDYDSAARTLRLYGGDSTSTAYTDVYSFDGAAWSLQTSAGRASVKGATMSFDASRNQLVTFGGILTSNSTVTDQTWTWSSTNGWIQSNPADKPPARDETATAYDPVRQRTVVFSGNPHTGGTLADVWEWNGASWNQIAASGPSQRSGHRLYYNSDAARVCVIGANTSGTTEDLWEWNGASWRQRPLVNALASRYQPAVAYDEASRALVVFGGRDASANLTASTALVQYVPNGAIEACTSAQVDYDRDGKAGCVDDECWGVCDPLHPPGTSRPAGAPYCGDGTCNGPENCNLCPGDCGACTGGTCGDFHCDSNAGETTYTCPTDC